MLDTACEKYQSVLSDCAAQRSRVRVYNDMIEQFVSAAEFYNSRVSEDVKLSKELSSLESVKSGKSYASRLSVSSSKAREARVQAERAALMQQQAEERSRKSIELEAKRIEMEIKRTQMELQHKLELTKLEAEKEVVAAKDQAQLAKLDALLAEQEISELNYQQEGIKWSPELEVHGRENQLQPLQLPIVSLPSVITSSLTLASAPMANPPLTSIPAADNPATTDRVYTNRGVCFSEPPKAPKPQLKAGAARDVSKLAEAHCHNQIQSQSLISVTSTSSTVTPGVSNANVSNANINESLAAIMSSMERISASHDLPHVRVQKFDGSPQDYPAFRQRFKQLVETKTLDDAVKMTRLLHFLEGPALIAVQRYEPLPGGLARALKTLEDLFGQPFQVVRASVESLTKGPVIQANDKESLQQYADMAQVTYDTLESVGYLSEMNADSLK